MIRNLVGGCALALTLTLTLGACQKQVETPFQPVAAEFRAAIGSGASTRVSGTQGDQWDDGDAIGITALETEYSNVPYIHQSGTFTPQSETIYLDGPQEVTFQAYYPYHAAGEVITAVTDEAAQSDPTAVDFLYASGATGSADNRQVNFTDQRGSGGSDCSFHHCMSRLTLTLRAGEDIDFTTQRPTRCSLVGAMLTGTFDTRSGLAQATPDGGTQTLTLSLADQTLSASTILFPQTFTDPLRLEVVYNGETYTATFPLPNNRLEAGYDYQYTATLRNSDISLATATITPWSPVTPGDVSAEL